ncbi:MAG: hypothetical protein ACHQHN_19290 [Sphingobacteriales bacterium]
MADNYLSEPLDEFFREMSYFNGNLYIANSMIESRSAQIKADFPAPQRLWETGLYYRDVTLHQDADNLFPTGYGYDVGTPTLAEQAIRSISFICCNTIVSIYEILDTFLKDVLAKVYVNTEHKPAFKLQMEYSDLTAVRSNLWQVKSERGFFKIIRRISPTYRQYEKRNINHFSFNDWYNMIELTRHVIVHNRQQATKALEAELKTKGYWELFTENFSIDQYDRSIIISHGQAREILQNFTGFGYLIYKTLSTDLALPYDEAPPTYKPLINVFTPKN